jgi:5-methyltetrahydropteroyltriglutamate--homocysteine methyltransferase
MITTAIGHYPRIGDTTEQQRLRRAIQANQAQTLSDAELRAIQDDVTAEVIGEQVGAGLDQVTDGQIRWDDQATYICLKLDGFERGGMIRYFDTNTYYRQPIAVRKVSWKAPILVGDWTFASTKSTKPVRALVTGPYTLARLAAERAYGGDRAAFTMDLAKALNAEAKALAAAGAKTIQIDEPALTLEPKDATLVGQALAQVFDGVSGVTRAVALYHGPQAEAFDAAASWACDHVNFDGVSDPRVIDRLASAGFPKAVGLGIVNARNTKLEAVSDLAKTVERVAAKVPLEKLALTPSCGLEFLPRDRAQKKLVRLVEAARAIGGAR